MKPVPTLLVGILLFCLGLMSGLLFPLMLTGNHSSGIQPDWLITGVRYADEANGWLGIVINNTGIVPVTIVKASVNLVKQSTNPSLPLTLQPDSGTLLNVNMSFNGSPQYDIRVYNSNGNSTELQLKPSYITSQAGVVLYPANFNFYGNNTKIDIDTGNSGTTDTTITEVYIGTSPSSMDNQTINPVQLRAGSVQRITVNYSWQNGATYYFRVLASTSQNLPWIQQAQTG
jgi:hypothetical protein